MTSDQRVGKELAGYRIERRIGQGGMGVVYLAEHLVLERKAALKLLPPDLAAGEAFRNRFLHESRAAARLHHPNIVTVYDAGEIEGQMYIAMHYVEGTDLAALLRREGRLDPARTLAILDQVASALDAAHAADLVHRDVKPGNVLLDVEERAYLTDFGLTKPVKAAGAFTATGQVVGTIYYIAPEQIRGEELDGRADVYSLGCVLYECLTGAVPFERDSDVSVMYAHVQDPPPRLSQLRPDLPRGLERVITRAMAKRRDDRPGSSTELLELAWKAAQEGGALGRLRRPLRPGPRPVPQRGDDPWVPTEVERRLPGDRPVPEGGDEDWVATDAEARRPAGLIARRALVVGGESGVRAVIQLGLADSGFEFSEAADGPTALALAREERPQIAFIDWGLENPSAAQLCEALRSDPATADTKVVMLVEWTREEDAGAALDAGADEVVTTPFSPLQLVVKVRHLLGPEALAG